MNLDNSTRSRPTIIKEKDLVIIYLNPEMMYPLTVKSGETFQTKRGAVCHSDIIGKKFGSTIPSSKGFVRVLEPTPELWTLVLPHRTQILYLADVAVITLQLGLRPGSLVVEAGTGSGSLSHAIIRTILPTGHLFTFDFHSDRVEKACREFEEHGLSQWVTIECRDVCKDGIFVKAEQQESEDERTQDENGSITIDAVFLDLPSPWHVIESAKKILKAEGRICSFSPCIEQTQKFCRALQETNRRELTSEVTEKIGYFYDIQTMECQQKRSFVIDFDLSQPILSTSKSDGKMDSSPQSKKRKMDDDTDEKQSISLLEDDKKLILTDKCNNDELSSCKSRKISVCRPIKNNTGHTGYLTFASFHHTR